jgi:hypothetical protein
MIWDIVKNILWTLAAIGAFVGGVVILAKLDINKFTVPEIVKEITVVCILLLIIGCVFMKIWQVRHKGDKQ